MNYSKQLTAFFNRIAIEKNITTTHISLYVTIFQSWNLNRFQNPIQISRDEIMKTSRIGSNATYHRCIRDLENMGFIKYSPSYNPFSGTSVTVIDLCAGKKIKNDNQTCTVSKQVKPRTSSMSEKVKAGTCSINEQVSEPPYIYNNINNKLYNKNNNISIDENFIEKNATCSVNEQVQKKNDKSVDHEKRKTPSLEKVKEYFAFQKSSEFEAERFFNYYSSNGWLIGGKTKMENWQASARNWMLNTTKFASVNPMSMAKETLKPQNLHASTDKNYSEPL
ncbi:MAG: transcriptional regulator [Flavobacterium sp.]